MSRRSGALVASLIALGILTTDVSPLQAQLRPRGGPTLHRAFAMTPGVVCRKVDGIDRVTPMPNATLTNLDKLKVYFCPLNFKVETDTKLPHPHRARFTEDGQIRRKGEKTPVAKEDKLLVYESRFDALDWRIYLVNDVGLEKLTPGEYEFDITLHDEIDGSAVARQTVPFRIVPVAEGPPAVETKPTSAPTPTPTKKKTKPGRSSQRRG